MLIAPVRGFGKTDKRDLMTQAVGRVPPGAIGRPVGAQGVHLGHPRCPSEDMGNDQPLGGGKRGRGVGVRGLAKGNCYDGSPETLPVSGVF